MPTFKVHHTLNANIAVATKVPRFRGSWFMGYSSKKYYAVEGIC